MMEYRFLWPFVLLIGLSIGSFLNVCIFRIPENMSVAAGSSICPVCRRRLKALDLIPVLSFIFLWGKCRYCKCRISLIYPIVELLTAVLFLIAFYLYGISLYMLLIWILSSVLIVASFIDLHALEIPNGISIWIAAIGAASFLVPDLVWWERVLGSFAACAPLLLILLITKGKAMGMGDIKLMAAVGLILGYKLSLFALFSAVIFGAVIGVLLLLLKKKGRKDEIAFVPMLSFGILFSIFLGNEIISWYLSILR